MRNRCLSLVLYLFVALVLSGVFTLASSLADSPTTIVRSDDDDTINIDLGNYIVYGGGGIDTLVLPLFPNEYEFTETGENQYTAQYFDYTLTIDNVEYVQFGTYFQTTLPVADILSGDVQDQLAKLTDLYLAFFGRAPDVSGLEYWQSQLLDVGRDFATISKDFAWSTEAQALYPQDGSNRDFVQTVYLNCFGRNPDPGGWDYWTDRLNALGVTDLNDRGAFVGELLLGAYAPTSGDEDRNLLINRHEVAMYYVNRLSAQPEEGFDAAINGLLALVSMDNRTRYKAKHVIDYVFHDEVTLTDVMSDPDLLDALWTHDPSLDVDDDGDGWTEIQGDCNDSMSTIYPGAVETCGDGIDQDCSGTDLLCPEDVDDDGDGYTESQGDCNDGLATIYPGAFETCNDGIDQDCSGTDLLCPEDVDDDGDASTTGILLTGDSVSSASSAMQDYDSGDRTTEDEIATTASGARIDRTKFSISFVSTATVNDINALLDSIDGKIVNMMAGVSIIIVKIPDPGDHAGLEEVITQLESNPLVIDVARALMTETESLPGNYPSSYSSSAIDHHIAVNAPAAWNAKNALSYPASNPPLLVMTDNFGDGPPNSDFDLLTLNPTNFDTGGGSLHGYHVLGIISGKHNSYELERSVREMVTGIYPGKLSFLAEDAIKLDWSTYTNEMLKIVKAFAENGRRVVINTSMSLGCSGFGGMTQKECVEKYGRFWLKKVRGDLAYLAGAPGGLEFDFLHLTAAGNDNGSTAIDASAWTAARLMPGLKNERDIDLANLTNTLVVENRKNTAAVPYEPDCLHVSSNYPGDISAIGTNVFSFTGANFTGSGYTGAGYNTGTSMSTPQVSGLAAYVWALKPSLTPQEVLDILMKTSRTPSTDPVCGGIRPQPVIDAYAAVLAADDTRVLDMSPPGNPFDAPARLAILDVLDSEGLPGENEAFDSYDLEKFIDELEIRDGRNVDYSRYDLNGDGYTGGDKKTRFNLNIDYPPTFENVNHYIDGQEHVFDENLVSDLGVLCFYAYSPLYTGDEAARDALLMPYKLECGNPQGDGTILFTRYLPPDGSGLYGGRALFSMNSVGGDVTMLASRENGKDVSDASWSPDLQQVVYRYGYLNRHDIWTVDSGGLLPLNLINDPETFYQDPDGIRRDDIAPQWSPDGSKILFLRGRDISDALYLNSGSTWIYVMDSNGQNMTKLTPDIYTASELNPIWTPDGRITFVSARKFTDWAGEPIIDYPSGLPTLGRWGALSGLYTMNADGSNPSRMIDETTGLEYLWNLVWSPGGAVLYFLMGGDIHSIHANGSGLTNLTSSFQNEIKAFALAPEGSKIAFTRDQDIFVMSTQGTNLTNLTNNQAGMVSNSAIWSPDSTEIAFHFKKQTTGGIAVMDTSGNNLRIISDMWEYPTDWK